MKEKAIGIHLDIFYLVFLSESLFKDLLQWILHINKVDETKELAI